MAFAEKLQKGFSEYEDENLMRFSNTSSSSKNNDNNSHKNYKNNYQNSKKLAFNNNFNNFNKSNSKSSYNNQSVYSKNDNDIEKLTNDFAKMRLAVCYRCYQKSHITRFSTNGLSSVNKNLLNQFNNNEHLN